MSDDNKKQPQEITKEKKLPSITEKKVKSAAYKTALRDNLLRRKKPKFLAQS